MLIIIDKLSPKAAAKASAQGARFSVKQRAEFAKGALCLRTETHNPNVKLGGARLATRKFRGVFHA
jgi:hypothetical protein